MGHIKKALDFIESKFMTGHFTEETVSLLFQLCAINTTPDTDPAVMRNNEEKVFKKILEELNGINGSGKFLPIDPGIEKHPAFSLLHFTKTETNPQGLGFDKVYEGRHNFVFSMSPEKTEGTPPDSRNLAVNAHIDVVSPFFPPRLEGKFLYGRGSCDDKASVVAMIRAIQLVDEIRKEKIAELKGKATFMFVVEEETGGNGSLSLAIDRNLKKEYDSVLVLECVGNHLYPANRGAVWYRTELNISEDEHIGAASYIVLEMEKEGRKIKDESAHPLFPHRPVQTCHGIIGHYGEHPSRICGFVSLLIKVKPEITHDMVQRLADKALEEYVKTYGDKSKINDPRTGRPKVEKHLELKKKSETEYILDIMGSTGHMGSILENDCAITKMAYMAREIMESIPDVSIKLNGNTADSGKFILEGGQGFLPTHSIDSVMKRMADAATKGLESYTGRFNPNSNAYCTTTYDKLHNSAFDGDPNSHSMKNATKAMKLCRLPAGDETPVGLSVSCDARLFASEYPRMPVITSGPGKLAHAHSDSECVEIAELMDSIKFLVVYILLETASIQEN